MEIQNASVIQGLLDRPFQVVAGKGGVGRTVVAAALAMRSARNGARTLLLEVNAPDSAPRYLDAVPAIDEPREVLENLWICRMTPAGSMREYALMVLRFKALYSLVFENRLVKYLLRSIPSLAEFTMLGKTWYHATQKLPNGQPRFERVIVDAPATGHAITFLSIARVVADVVPAGIMKTASNEMAELLESGSGSCLHIVALPEEMPVNEALQLAQLGRGRLRMSLGLGVMNRMLVPLLDAGEAPVLEQLQLSPDPTVRPYCDAALRRRDREAWQAECLARFVAESRLPVLEIPELDGPRSGARWLERVVASFDRASGTGAPLARASDG